MSNAGNHKRRATIRFYSAIAIAVVLVAGFALIASGVLKTGGTPVSTGTAAPPAVGVSEEDYSKFATIPGQDSDAYTPIDPSDYVTVTDLSARAGLSSEWTNILLIGEDWELGRGWGRADTMIIASVNTNDGRVKLTSIQRDTIIEIPDKGLQRINSTNQFGGPELTVKLVNEYFGMNITKYVSVDFLSFPILVERLGGVTVEITEREWEALETGVGNSIWCDILAFKETGRPMPDLDNTIRPDGPGVVRLTGRQALAYSRIRHIDNDFMRSQRQRKVLTAILAEVRGVDFTTLSNLANEMMPYVRTNLTTLDMLTLAASVMANGAVIVGDARLPGQGTYVEERRPIGLHDDIALAFFDVDFEANRKNLYDFIYD